jgi:hypothetical protein
LTGVNTCRIHCNEETIGVVTGKQEFDYCKGQKLFLFHVDSTPTMKPSQTNSRKLIAGFYPVLSVTLSV